MDAFQIAGISADWSERLNSRVRKPTPFRLRCLRWIAVKSLGPTAVEFFDALIASMTYRVKKTAVWSITLLIFISQSFP